MRTRRPTATWHTANGVTLKIVALPSGPDLLSWWWPLHRASRWAWFARILWPINLEDFQVVGLVPRSGRPDLWVYRHTGTCMELFVDDEGATYRLRPLRTRPSEGRFTSCDIRTAIYQCGLHFLPPVEPWDWDQETGLHQVVTPFPRRVAVGPAPGGIAGSIGPAAGPLPPPSGPPAPGGRRSPSAALRAVPDLGPAPIPAERTGVPPGEGAPPVDAEQPAGGASGEDGGDPPGGSGPSGPRRPTTSERSSPTVELGPHGETGCRTCDDGTCPDCRELAHRYNGWCEDPTCPRCNDDEPWWLHLLDAPADPTDPADGPSTPPRFDPIDLLDAADEWEHDATPEPLALDPTDPDPGGPGVPADPEDRFDPEDPLDPGGPTGTGDPADAFGWGADRDGPPFPTGGRAPVDRGAPRWRPRGTPGRAAPRRGRWRGTLPPP